MGFEMDAVIHLIIGSVLEKFSRRKLWLYAIPAFLSHAYVDIVTVHWEKPLNWFGFLAGSNKSGITYKLNASHGTIKSTVVVLDNEYRKLLSVSAVIVLIGLSFKHFLSSLKCFFVINYGAVF